MKGEIEYNRYGKTQTIRFSGTENDLVNALKKHEAGKPIFKPKKPGPPLMLKDNDLVPVGN